jgi:hypothetical protein
MPVVDDPLINQYGQAFDQIGYYKNQIKEEGAIIKEIESILRSKYTECGQYIDSKSRESIIIKERLTVSSSYKQSAEDLKEYLVGRFKAYIHLVLIKELGLGNDSPVIERVASQLSSAILNEMSVTKNLNVGQKTPKRIMEYGGRV